MSSRQERVFLSSSQNAAPWREKKKKRNKILCNFKVCGGNFPEISFLAGSTVQKSEKRSTA